MRTRDMRKKPSINENHAKDQLGDRGNQEAQQNKKKQCQSNPIGSNINSSITLNNNSTHSNPNIKQSETLEGN